MAGGILPPAIARLRAAGGRIPPAGGQQRTLAGTKVPDAAHRCRGSWA